jgi:hypothetical protein
MSQLQIRNDLLTQAISTMTPLVGDKLAYENNDFDPKGLSIWSDFVFRPATSESCGKSVASSDEERGFIQLSIYIKSNALSYDNEQLAAIDTIKKDFYFGAVFGGVQIMEVTVGDAFPVESWFKRPVTINYTAFAGRG